MTLSAKELTAKVTPPAFPCGHPKAGNIKPVTVRSKSGKEYHYERCRECRREAWRIWDEDRYRLRARGAGGGVVEGVNGGRA